MQYAKPEYARERVNAAANVVRDFFLRKGGFEEAGDALHVVDNWRASHAYPLNSFTMTLRNRALRVSSQALVSQRVKRLPSIALKLVDRPTMKMTQMQDVAGCRAVLPTLKEVYDLCEMYRFDGRLVHTSAGDGLKDYIVEPKPSGYRSIHLKYRFTGKERTLPYDGMKVEIQLRTLQQHRWATAVEAAGTFTREALKSSRGEPEWLRFFGLMSSVFAIREGCLPTPGTPATLPELRAEIQALDREHRIGATFHQYHSLVAEIENERDAGDFYFLLKLDPDAGSVDVRGFKKTESQDANAAYTELERELPPNSAVQVVLVSVSSISALRRAYPNYFMDTADFLEQLRELLA